MERWFSRLRIFQSSPVPFIQESEENKLLKIPPEIRSKIWQKVGREARRTLRQVCRTVLDDVDQIVGVHGIMTGSQNNLDFLWSVKLLSVRVDTRLRPALPRHHAWKNPYTLQSLSIVQGTIGHRNLLGILETFTNLRQLVLTLPEDLPCSDREISKIKRNCLTPANMPKILAAIRQNTHLEELEIQLIPPIRDQALQTCECDSVMKNLSQNDKSPIQKKSEWSQDAKLKSLTLYCPEVPENHRESWKGFLDAQDKLETFSIELGQGHWTFYRTLIRNSKLTLTRIELYDLEVMQGKIPVTLDWSVFKGCVHLTVLKISGKPYGTRILNSNNMDKFRFERLRQLHLVRVRLTSGILEKLIKCTTGKLSDLQLESFRCRMTTLYSELEWTLTYAQFQRISICDRISFFKSQVCPDDELKKACERENYFYTELVTPQPGYGYLKLEKRARHPALC